MGWVIVNLNFILLVVGFVDCVMLFVGFVERVLVEMFVEEGEVWYVL